jgi:hypothetical protein
LSPADGQEVSAGDAVQVQLQAVAPETIVEAQLFVDGMPIGAVTDHAETASWIWQAWPAGVHALYARASTAGGETGQSQSVIVNTLLGDGVIEVDAPQGQTLAGIGEQYGVGLSDLEGANPGVDPESPLGEGESIKVPVPESAAGDQGPGGGGLKWIPIAWSLKFTEPVDESYCYTSKGDGEWGKMPQNPFTYFPGVDSTYTQLVSLSSEVVLQAECWGWLAGALKYLGSGQTAFDLHSAPESIALSGDGFEFIGMPKYPDLPPIPVAAGSVVPPPYGARQPLNADDCVAHGLDAAQCDFLVNTHQPSSMVVEWEWQLPVCWPGACNYVQAIDGYRLYIFDDPTNVKYFVKEISDPGLKVGVFPLSWAGQCYGITAYVNAPVPMESALELFCPGTPLDKIVLQPTHWLTAGQLSDFWYDEMKAPDGAVVVSASNYGDETRASAAVKFENPVFAPEEVVHRAFFSFMILGQSASASGVASGLWPSCVASIGKGTKDWTVLEGGANHYYAGGNVLASSAYQTMIASVPNYPPSLVEVDVTSAVKAWIQDPSKNHGLVLVARASPSMAVDEGGAYCNSTEGNFQLTIQYVKP